MMTNAPAVASEPPPVGSLPACLECGFRLSDLLTRPRLLIDACPDCRGRYLESLPICAGCGQPFEELDAGWLFADTCDACQTNLFDGMIYALVAAESGRERRAALEALERLAPPVHGRGPRGDVMARGSAAMPLPTPHRRACRKVPHASHESAEAERRRLVALAQSPATQRYAVYYCRKCRAFHVGLERLERRGDRP